MIRRFISVPLLAFLVMLTPAVRSNAEEHTTLRNLQAAYSGELSAQVKYLEFARHADFEGYHRAASLFRAAAASEQIHRLCEGAIIEKMGAIPEPEIKSPSIKPTRENLEESANKGEAYERDTMYPQFIAQAQKEGRSGAAQCFVWARDAEAEHFNLFSAAAHDLDQTKEKRVTYFVCSQGGYTMDTLNVAKCPGGEYQKIK